MKPSKKSLLCLALLGCTAASSHAVVLFTDNFTVTSGSQNVATQELAGRLGGTLAPGLITAGSAYLEGNLHHQVGNTTTDVGQPLVSEGNYVLLAFNGGFQSTVDIAAAATGPVMIGFDMYMSQNNGGDPTNWGSFALRGAGGNNGFPVAGTGEFGMLRRTNGGIQVFENGSSGVTPAGYDTVGFTSNLDPHWEWTFTNTAGTGSAFNGTGSVANWVNGLNSGSITLSQLSSSGLFVGFSQAGNRFVGIDNLSIATIPEPSSMMAGLSGLAGLVLLRRRK